MPALDAPPPRSRAPVAVLVGVILGIGIAALLAQRATPPRHPEAARDGGSFDSPRPNRNTPAPRWSTSVTPSAK